MKKILISILLLQSLFLMPVAAEVSFYVVKDGFTDYEIGRFETLKEAREVYDQNKAGYDELVVTLNDQIIMMEYGVLSIPSGTCETNYEFKNDITKDGGYVNGCYGGDALYLGTSEDGQQVKFMISGAIGWGKLSDVELVLASQINQLSSYVVVEGKLYHRIKRDLHKENYASLIYLSDAPMYLEENQVYLSYDGHYFYLYDEFVVMSDDVRSGRRTHAINSDDPYFNYYQYVTHRTMTAATMNQIESYFRDNLKISGSIKTYNDQDKDSSHDILTQSQYFGYESMFFQYQNQFGSNALMMLALSMNESAVGRSSLSFTRNNLFGHAAYDSDVEKNASRYLSVSNSVYSHAKNYISGSYLNINKFMYHGGFFGDKASGMNVSYASDPYWGEKAAQYYAQLDEALGSLDKDRYCLGIKTSSISIPILDENGNELYRSGINPNMSFVILGETQDQYKIQLDLAMYGIVGNSAANTYDFNRNIGYVFKKDIQVILNQQNMHSNQVVEVVFDAKEGTFYDESKQIVLQVLKGEIPTVEAPVKENAIFSGWHREIEVAVDRMVYTAVYRDITSIAMAKEPATILEYNDRLDISDGKVLVNYSDGTSEEIVLTTSMVSNYDIKQEGQQEVIVTFGGSTTSYPLEVIMDLDTIRREITTEIEAVISEYKDKTDFTKEEQKRLENLKVKMETYMFPYMNFTTLRLLDKIYYNACYQQVFTVLERNDRNLAVSGLQFVTYAKSAFENQLMKDTIRLWIDDGVQDQEAATLMQQVAEANQFLVHDLFMMEGKMNSDELILNDYILVSIDKPTSIQDNQIVTVLQHIDGDVVKLATQQTANKLIFKTNRLGMYSIVTRNSMNTYNTVDILETNHLDNNGFNIYAFMQVVPWVILGILMLLILWILMLKKNKKRN